ncbi:diaminobutyrate--2-oxoglutarate transaminase [Novispirillum sp. DQ9]|uniref:diaminobutyrate--2-oxoglutarate transaminase n=1 Tax=Novispirillum sp. DQ9 TaxID=3398612 RepID=UPI003C7AE92A
MTLDSITNTSSDGDVGASEGDPRPATPHAGVARSSRRSIPPSGPLTFRRPTHRDGAAMWRLVKASGALDENSAYAYLMMGEWFADTCVVAEERLPGGDRRLAGFVMGFVPPNQPDTAFVWQVGVDPRQRGRGLGTRLIRQFIDRAPAGVCFLEATVTPSNAASEALFRASARTFGAGIQVRDLFAAAAFPPEACTGAGHEPERLFRIGPIDATANGRNDVDAFETYESNVRSYIRNFPEVFVSAKGARVTGRSGREYIDFFAGAGALNYGHNDEGMKRRLMDYIAADGIAHSLDMATAAKERFLTRFNEVILAPRGMDHKMMFPGPTGTNAVESALKLARKVTGREKVVSFTNAFHGMTLGALAVTGNAFKRSGAGLPLDNTIFMPYAGYMDDLDSLAYFERTLEDGGSGIDLPAAVIVEAVQGEGGINACSMEWLRRLEALCRRWDMLLILDDIQAGCGRTGTFFSFEPAGISPDLICLSKSLSGYGLPLSVVLIKPHYDVFAAGEHNGTFRGNNMAFITATEALRFWETDALSKDVARKAGIVRAAFDRIAQAHPEFAPEVRGRGLMQGIALNSGDAAAAICGEAFSNGVLMETSGPDGEVVKILCPLTIPDADLTTGLDILADAFATVARARAGDARSAA